jgi:hypothetical protein
MKQTFDVTQTLEDQVDRWKTEIKKFRVIAEVADKDAQIKHYQIIDGITDKITIFTDKLGELKEASTKHRETVVEDLNGLRDEIDEAIEAARKSIN